MRLILFRHGIAQDRATAGTQRDPERALTSKGIERTTAAARGLAAMGVKPGLILTSPYLRAVETARIANRALGVPADRTRETGALLPDARPEELFALVAREKEGEILCVGHAPNLDAVLARAVLGSSERTPFTELKKAGAAAVDFSVPGRAGGTLLWLLGSKALRALAPDS